MKHAKTYLGLASASALGIVLLASTGLGTVIAQGPFDDVLAFIVNDAENPVPVVPAGRQRYQTTFAVFNDSGSEECSPIATPDGTTLTIDTVGVSVQTDGSNLPRTYLLVVRLFGGGSQFLRFGGELHPVSTSLGITSYDGLFNMDLFAGFAGEDLEYQVYICVGGISGDATFREARGVVVGYLEPGGIVDGNLLP